MARAPKKTKRPYGSGSIIFNKKTGLHVGRIRLGYKPDGSPKIVSFKSKSWDTVNDKIDEARQTFRETGAVLDKKTTMAQWGEKWLTEIASKNLGPNTYATHASLMRKWVIPTIGKRIVSELTPGDIRAIQVAMEHNTVNGQPRPLSSTTALQCYRMLSKCLEDARRNNLAAHNVCDRVDPPKKAVSKRGAFTVDQVLAIVAAAGQDQGLGSRWVAQLFMGLRQGETLGLTWNSVNLEAGTARVSWQLQELTYRHTCGPRPADGRYPCGFKQAGRCPGKQFAVPDGYEYEILGGKLALTRPKSRAGERTVPMIPPMVVALRDHRVRTADRPNPHNLVWHNDGLPLAEKADQEGWKNLLESVGLPRTCTTHWARHSVATLLKAAGVDTLVIGEIVGHGSTAVTDGYIHISSDLAKDAMGRLDSLLTPVTAAGELLEVPGPLGSVPPLPTLRLAAELVTTNPEECLCPKPKQRPTSRRR